MRILQINSVCDFGSTGRTTRELADYIEQQGHECYVAYGYRTTNYHRAFKIGGKWENLFHNAFYTRLLGLHGYGTRCGTKRLLKWIDEIKPDIIHLRNLHANYLNFPLLFEYIIFHHIPVVFTLHDCFNFTGKCAHYTALKCYKWQSSCGKCPTFRDCIAPSMFFDQSKKLFMQKKSYYDKVDNLTIVAVSKWLAGEAQKSPMFSSAREITYIYNWIDHNKFQRANNDEVEDFYNKYKLDREYKYLVSVSQGWDNSESRYKDAKKLADKLPRGYKLILVGNVSRGSTIEAPLIHIPHIDGYKELSAAYSMAEAYVHLSVEDTFGKVIAEAMSCGTVPITFNSTACGEVPGPFGIVVAPHDVDAIVQVLPSLPEYQEKSNSIIKYVLKHYDYLTNAQQYLIMYENILNI